MARGRRSQHAHADPDLNDSRSDSVEEKEKEGEVDRGAMTTSYEVQPVGVSVAPR
jgi:hypothetical protein